MDFTYVVNVKLLSMYVIKDSNRNKMCISLSESLRILHEFWCVDHLPPLSLTLERIEVWSNVFLTIR